MPDYVGQWDIQPEGVHAVIRQTKYIAPGQHPDEALFIDCALYAYFSISQVVAEGSVRGVTPERIHYTRTVLALHLVRDDLQTDIRYWLVPISAPVSYSASYSIQHAPAPVVERVAVVLWMRSRPFILGR